MVNVVKSAVCKTVAFWLFGFDSLYSYKQKQLMRISPQVEPFGELNASLKHSAICGLLVWHVDNLSRLALDLGVSLSVFKAF
tara:strand:+ start:27148 stop:27393 length:246 start_codon:yes stop_codon:yes gene_type:complete